MENTDSQALRYGEKGRYGTEGTRTPLPSLSPPSTPTPHNANTTTPLTHTPWTYWNATTISNTTTSSSSISADPTELTFDIGFDPFFAIEGNNFYYGNLVAHIESAVASLNLPTVFYVQTGVAPPLETGSPDPSTGKDGGAGSGGNGGTGVGEPKGLNGLFKSPALGAIVSAVGDAVGEAAGGESGGGSPSPPTGSGNGATNGNGNGNGNGNTGSPLNPASPPSPDGSTGQSSSGEQRGASSTAGSGSSPPAASGNGATNSNEGSPPGNDGSAGMSGLSVGVTGVAGGRAPETAGIKQLEPGAGGQSQLEEIRLALLRVGLLSRRVEEIKLLEENQLMEINQLEPATLVQSQVRHLAIMLWPASFLSCHGLGRLRQGSRHRRVKEASHLEEASRLKEVNLKEVCQRKEVNWLREINLSKALKEFNQMELAAGGSPPSPSQALPMLPVLTIGSHQYTANAATQYYLALGQTLTPGGAATLDGTLLSLGPTASYIVVDGSTRDIPRPITTQAPAYTPGSSNGIPSFNIGGQILTPGGAITISGNTISLDIAASNLVVNGVTKYLGDSDSESGVTAGPFLTVAGTIYAAVDGTSFVYGSQILTPGDAITVGSNRISLDADDNYIVINGQTSSLQHTNPFITGAPYLIIDGATITPTTLGRNSATGYKISSQTLLPGSYITLSGSIVSLSPSFNALVINGKTELLTPQIHTWLPTLSFSNSVLGSGSGPGSGSGSGSSPNHLNLLAAILGSGHTYLIAGQTLTPGAIITVTRTTISLLPDASAAVVNGVTQTLVANSPFSIPAVTTASGAATGPAPPNASPNPPILTINGLTYTAASPGPPLRYLIDGQVLTPGGMIVLHGTTISLSQMATALVVGGSTEILGGAGTTTATAVVGAMGSRGGSGSGTATAVMTGMGGTGKVPSVVVGSGSTATGTAAVEGGGGKGVEVEMGFVLGIALVGGWFWMVV
ncbi:hypothetical protein K490DRAFT_68887 [Saccharata proteae CBS 121410]|uniref:Uncharacterized protein n=1 Tax=Saccharata proteae CBS 121410 TaxID=1314787 RepID=A0A9P4HQV1_9PEZI|nr:hypothetical protein K490DRAFT_68887 [Saccharata proteae CBS 121410]